MLDVVVAAAAELGTVPPTAAAESGHCNTAAAESVGLRQLQLQTIAAAAVGSRTDRQWMQIHLSNQPMASVAAETGSHTLVAVRMMAVQKMTMECNLEMSKLEFSAAGEMLV